MRNTSPSKPRAGRRPRKEKQSAVPTSKLAQLAYEHLQEQLWSGGLAAGEKISEARLAAGLGMSRTPVREAIRRMETEGVVTQVASSGTYVTVPERCEIVEGDERRMAHKKFALGKGTPRMKPGQGGEVEK